MERCLCPSSVSVSLRARVEEMIRSKDQCARIFSARGWHPDWQNKIHRDVSNRDQTRVCNSGTISQETHPFLQRLEPSEVQS